MKWQLCCVCFAESVVFVDPRLVLHNTASDFVSVRLPVSLTPLLSQAAHVLGDFDDPMNAYVAGQRGEVFQYHFVGSHSSASGYASVLKEEVFEELQAGRRRVDIDWPTFIRMSQEEGIKYPHEGLPFLFAAPVLESDVKVFVRKDKGQITGVMMASMGEELD